MDDDTKMTKGRKPFTVTPDDGGVLDLIGKAKPEVGTVKITNVEVVPTPPVALQRVGSAALAAEQEAGRRTLRDKFGTSSLEVEQAAGKQTIGTTGV